MNRRQMLRQASAATTWLGTASMRDQAGAANAGPLPRGGGLVDLPFNKEVTQAITRARQAGRWFPGMVAAVVRGDRLLGAAAFGVRKLAAPAPVEVTDRFHLGSCGKAMTATTIAATVDAGKLRWDSTLAAVLPTETATCHSGYRGVTLDQLLHHRAGLPADVAYETFATAGLTTTQGRRAVLANALKAAPLTGPGSTFEYSNVGYMLAALMAEEVTATPWETLMRQTLFEPLGMASAGFGSPGAGDSMAEPWGHLSFGPIYAPQHGDNPAVMGPAGTIHVSIADWAKFAAVHLGDGSSHGRRIITAGSLTKLHTPEPGQDYAGGWLVTPPVAKAKGPLLDHGGSNTMWFAYILLAPGLGFGALVACNGGGSFAEAACTEVAVNLHKLEPATRG